MKPPKLIAAIVCEDMRQETTGKFTLLSVSSGVLFVAEQFPLVVQMALLLEVQPSEIGNFSFEFRATNHRGDTIIAGNGRMGFANEYVSCFPLGPFPLKIDAFGNYKIELRFDSGKWETIKTLVFSKPPENFTPHSSASAPPSSQSPPGAPTS